MLHKKNNFDFLRLIFASFVIITHSYPLSGMVERDIICQITNCQISFSYIGVKGFFVISGYLIFQSLQRSENIIDYFWKRFLRVFPALFVVLILTILLVPFIYEGETPLLQNKSYINYLPNNLSLYRMQYFITGVFENIPYKSTINGSLWTIPYEFTMYILVSLLIIFRKRRIISQIILAVVFFSLLIVNTFFFKYISGSFYSIEYKHLFDLGVFFAAGALLSALKIENLKGKRIILSVLFVLVIASFYFNFFHNIKYVILPLIFILFGLTPMPFIYNIGNKIGDLSYGIYIYGFVLQQTLEYFFRLNYIELMFCSLPLSALFAFFSWHCIEKKALQLKKIRPTESLVWIRNKYIKTFGQHKID